MQIEFFGEHPALRRGDRRSVCLAAEKAHKALFQFLREIERVTPGGQVATVAFTSGRCAVLATVSTESIFPNGPAPSNHPPGAQ